MSETGQRFGFFLEALAEEHESAEPPRDAEPRPPELPWIDLPPSKASYLTVKPGKSPRVVSKAPAMNVRVGVFQTVRYERQTYLTMLPSREVRLNGLPVPPVAILRVGDQLRLDAGWLLHVSRFTRPRVGPPPKEHLGKPCSYCRLPFVPNTVTYICPECGTPVHCEDEDHLSNVELGPLECARLMSECHHCHQPIVLHQRHECVPQS